MNLIIVHLNFRMQIKSPRLSLYEHNVDQRELVEKLIMLLYVVIWDQFCLIPENCHYNAIATMLLK